jgi:DNA-binding MarR family transcriptional regulator
VLNKYKNRYSDQFLSIGKWHQSCCIATVDIPQLLFDFMSNALLLTRFFAYANEMSRTTARYCGLSPQLARALLLIDECKPCCVRKLTEMMGIHSTAMSKIISRLIELGLVVRTLDQNDRRVEHIELTSLGLQSSVSYKERLNTIADAVKTAYAPDNESKHLNDINRIKHMVNILSHL